MFLKTVVCSGVNEKNDIQETILFLKKHPNLELGVQCSPKKAGYGTDRFEWLKELTSKLDQENIIGRIALHLNEGFAVSFCSGNIPKEVLYLKKHSSAVGRLQLNFKIGREIFENEQIAPDIQKLKKSIEQLSDHRVIVSASKTNLPFIYKMHHQGIQFDALFDDSFGEGVLPEKRQKPLFDDVFQGYAGGISPENVTQELQKIAKVAVGNVFIDAEGKLKENGTFSFEKAEKYVQNALSWNLMQRHNSQHR